MPPSIDAAARVRDARRDPRARRVLVGEIGRPHGLRGLVRLRSFTVEPAAIAAYGPLTDTTGARRFALTLKGDGLAQIEGVADRDAAARLTGTRLFVERHLLPPPQDAEEFYLADLIGLAAETESGQPLGCVRAVEDHGAGSFLVLDGPPERMVPFTRAVVPVVDIDSGRLVVVPPAEIDAPPPPADDPATDGPAADGRMPAAAGSATQEYG